MDPQVRVAGESSRNLGKSGHTTLHAQMRRIWIWIGIAVVLLAGIGFSIDRVLGRLVRERALGHLKGRLASTAKAYDLWVHAQEATVAGFCADASIHEAVERAIAVSASGTASPVVLAASEPVITLRRTLGAQLVERGYAGFMVAVPFDGDFLSVASDSDQLIGTRIRDYRATFFQRVFTEGRRVSRPYKTTVLLPDAKGQMRADLPTMVAAARVKMPDGKPIAILAIRMRPEEEYSQIMRLGDMGDTGEIFAMSDGRLVSRSRFEDDLRGAGLLPEDPDVSSILAIELRVPDADIRAGHHGRKRAELPFTRPVTELREGKSGGDITDYISYRGTSVLGAWMTLPRNEVGLVSEMDLAEALAPVRYLRTIFGGLLVLLAVSAVAIALFLAKVARQAQAVKQAERAASAAGQYVLEEKIGQGGMGSVWKARHAFLRRPTAVKVLDAKGDESSESILRFEREVQMTAGLSSPHTIAIYDYGRLGDGRFFYAMEFLDGLDLSALVRRHGLLPEGRVISILIQACDSLEEAHLHGLVHRDVKPANIFLCRRTGAPDFVKVVDFGLVKDRGMTGTEANLTGTHVLLGTPNYMAPESIESARSIDCRADIYAIGAVGVFLLTGKPPFEADTITELIAKHLREKPEPPSKRLNEPVSPKLEALLLRCLEKDPADRPQTMAAVREALEACEKYGAWSRLDAEKWWKANMGGSGVGAMTVSLDGLKGLR